MNTNGAFNNDKYATEDMLRIVKNFGVKTFIETGTFRGNTTFFMADQVKNVISIEVNSEFYNDVKSRNQKENVDLRFGNSGKVLKDILEEQPEDTVLFYLDAHWHDYWPLKDELTIIEQYKKNNCIVVIDDFQVPDRSDILFDIYHGIHNYYQNIKDYLDRVFSDGYDYYYTHKYERVNHNSGKIFVFPKKWDCSAFYNKNETNLVNYSNI